MKSKEKIILDFSVKNCIKSQSYQILIKSDNKSLGIKGQFQTELIECKHDNEEIIFKEKLEVHFNFCERQKLNITFRMKYFIDEHKNYKLKNVIRETELSSIIASPNSIYERNLKKEIKNKDIFCIKANKIKVGNKEEIKIYDFISSGIKLNTFMAFDFSDGLNKQPRKNSIDNYSKVINNLINKIFNYSKRHSTYLYGFGGKLNNQEDLFNFNQGENSTIFLSNCIKVYESTKNNIIPKKNIFLSKLIRKITKVIYSIYEARNYNVLFIFEREIPDSADKQELIDTFIEASYLPLTIIIIGEGKNDFNKLKKLFSSEINEASSGMLKNRENILFTDFYNNFNENEEKLTQWCLEELSKQMIEFYKLVNTSPQKIWKNNMKEIEQSFMNYRKVSVCISQSIQQSNNFMSNIFVSKLNINNDNNNENVKLIKEIPYKNEIINLNYNNENSIKKINDNDFINTDNVYTPDKSINDNFCLSNPYVDDDNEDKKIDQIKKGEKMEKYDDKVYKITPGESIFNLDQANPYNPKNENIEKKLRTFKITPGSIWTFNPEENPYNKIEEEPKEDKEKKEEEIPKGNIYFIPQRSTWMSIIDNPYGLEKKKNNINVEKKESKAETYDESTEESSKNSNNIKLKISNQIRLNLNYSVDN